MCCISVIIPVYNVEKYIQKCLLSITKQTYKDFEIIIVNDGSTDNSIDYIQEISIKQKLKIIHKKNAGLPQARKTGFENANGKYILFVDADDWIEPDCLEKMYHCMCDTHADIVCCNIELDDENNTYLEEYSIHHQTTYSSQEAIQSVHKMNGIYQYMWNKLFNKEVLSPDVFPEGHFIGEDYCTLMPILEKAKKIVQIPHNLYHYIQHHSNMTKAGFGTSFILGYKNFIQQKSHLLYTYPFMRKEISNYHILMEMAILNAMLRNEEYDFQILNNILLDIRKNLFGYIFNLYTKLIYKGSALAISINWKLYKKVYLKYVKK